ncbi:hypothetical protein [Natrinema sp. CBA1119]|uniref:hypothetical protein n=1 Tax=Natrinema sp. CBA1119 TaxID=1608465 RepID=UPI00159BC733|nr:hypothetical protein [Natrinema sp. CBA1119]
MAFEKPFPVCSRDRDGSAGAACGESGTVHDELLEETPDDVRDVPAADATEHYSNN